MNIGILYNIFVCLTCGIASISVFVTIQRKRKEEDVTYSSGLDYFLLMFGLLWFMIGLRSFFIWINKLEWNLLMFKWVSGPLVYIHLLPGFVYFGWSFFPEKDRIRKLFIGFFAIVCLTAVFAFFQYGFIEGNLTYWGAKHKPNDVANKIFIFGIFLPAFSLILADLVRRYRAWRKNRGTNERRLLGFSFGFLIYAIMGVFDALGRAGGWLMVLSRMGITTAPLIFYFFTTWE
ncbi:MAG: hypothetical protein GF370_01290 [Candidatus Nealsonbacteria bacterium]|nr:hypothetical protein [Candidatus Nealsonbacteria bacterium]